MTSGSAPTPGTAIRFHRNRQPTAFSNPGRARPLTGLASTSSGARAHSPSVSAQAAARTIDTVAPRDRASSRTSGTAK